MLTAMPAELLDYGLLSGLQTQSEISELLEELYYEALKYPFRQETGSVSRSSTSEMIRTTGQSPAQDRYRDHGQVKPLCAPPGTRVMVCGLAPSGGRPS